MICSVEKHRNTKYNSSLLFTCRGSGEPLRRPTIVPVKGLRRTSSKSTLVAPHPGLGLGVRGSSHITLLTHVDGTTLMIFSCQVRRHNLRHCKCERSRLVFPLKLNVKKKTKHKFQIKIINTRAAVSGKSCVYKAITTTPDF